jgi:uncharacterized protein (DUF302 family)
MTQQIAVSASQHTMTRLDIGTRTPFEAFVAAFHAAVPDFDRARVAAIVERGGTWADVETAAADNAPHGFVLFGTIDIRPVMAVAGHTRPAIEYLMGNHVIAERMFRHDAGAMLYAPLRITIHESASGQVLFALDRPSDMFAALGRPQITEVGRELDRKVGVLLRHLDAPVPAELT